MVQGMELGNVIREFLQYDGANKTDMPSSMLRNISGQAREPCTDM